MESEEMDIRYAYLCKRCLDFILNVRKQNISEPILSIIETFCFKNNILLEEMGDAISQDAEFKELILLDTKVKPQENVDLDLEDW